MPEEKADRELDLTHIDSLLQDLEKDLEAGPPPVPAAPGSQPATPDAALDIPDLPPPVELDALKTHTVPAPLATAVDAPSSLTAATEMPVAEPPAVEAPVAEEPAVEVPPAPTPAAQTPQPPAPAEEAEELSVDELLSPPVRSSERAEMEEMEDMFTDEEDEHPKRAPVVAAEEEEDHVAPAEPPKPVVPPPAPVAIARDVPPAPEPPVPVAVPAAAVSPAGTEDDQSFLDALESDVEVIAPKAPEATAVAATPEMFTEAVRSKNYAQAVQIGQVLSAKESGVPFRINFAGALYHAGMREDAERELLAILESNPYHVVARRNLLFVRAGRT